MSYKYEVFEHLQLLCIDIWLHTHSVIITNVSPDLGAHSLRYHHRRSPGLGKLAEILGNVSVQTIPLRYG